MQSTATEPHSKCHTLHVYDDHDCATVTASVHPPQCHRRSPERASKSPDILIRRRPLFRQGKAFQTRIPQHIASTYTSRTTNSQHLGVMVPTERASGNFSQPNPPKPWANPIRVNLWIVKLSQSGPCVGLAHGLGWIGSTVAKVLKF